MLTGMTKFIAFAVIIVASVGLLSGNTLMEQTVKAQNMTTNMIDSAWQYDWNW